MQAVTLTSKGNFDRTKRFLNKMENMNLYSILARYGQEGVRRLEQATPKRTGLTSRSWTYKIRVQRNDFGVLEFWNTNENDGVPIALLIQYGHGTGTFGYVPGIDYINPALQPVFEQMANDIWKEVVNG